MFERLVFNRLLEGLPDTFDAIVDYSNNIVGVEDAEYYFDSCVSALGDDLVSSFVDRLSSFLLGVPALCPRLYSFLMKNRNKSFSSALLQDVSFMGSLMENDVVRQMSLYYQYREGSGSIFNNFYSKPTYYLGDVINVMSNYVPDSSINLIFTSPPYFNARDYSQYKNLDEYFSFIRDVFTQCFRVLEDGRFLIVNVSPVICQVPNGDSLRIPLHFEFHRLFVESGFTFVDEIIWRKPDASVVNRVGNFLKGRVPCTYKPNPVTESILVYRKNVGRTLTDTISRYRGLDHGNNDLSIDRTNVWDINPSSDVVHTAVFPEALCEKVLNYYSFSGDIVMDVFGGSGTFGRVAHRLGRTPVLIERDRNFFNWGRHLTPFYYDLKVVDSIG